MFLRPFLKYFRPFLPRIIVAVICMVIVGALSTAPFLILKGTLATLGDWAASHPQAVAGPHGSGKAPAELTLLMSHKSGAGGLLSGVADDDTTDSQATTTTTTAAAGHKPKPTNVIREWRHRLEAALGPWYAVPKAWYEGHRAAVAEWFHNRSRLQPLQVLAALGGLLILLTAIKGLSEYCSKYQLAITFFYSNLRIREDIYFNILRQDYNFFNRHSSGYLQSRIGSDVKAVGDILEDLLSDGIQQPITILAMFAMLLYIDWHLTLGVLVVLPFIGGLLYYFARVLRKNTRKQKKQADQLSSALTESLNNIRLIKAFGTEDFEAEKYHVRSVELFKVMMARRTAKFGASPLMEFLGMCAMGIVLLAGGYMLTTGKIQFDNLLIFFGALTRFYRPVRQLATMNNKYQIAKVSAERMGEMLGLIPHIQDRSDALPFKQVGQSIEFRDVSFSYAEKEILHGISFHVAAGHSVAFAGPSGAGKTTLVNMLARLFDPSEGAILIDGIDLRCYKINDWRRQLAIVTQDTFLFDDTIAANIAYGEDDPDLKRIEESSRAANAHEFIMTLDGGLGYMTRIGPGGMRLSGGQRQRIAIARALYRDPKILILDEATSALDAQSQALVQEALSRLMVGRTTFIVAHRISTIRNVDCIYVLSQGRVVESGSHDDLVNQGGLYARLARQGGHGTVHVAGRKAAGGDETSEASAAQA
jgi:ABC-type multidrug transport system fused ATPase/permease subunit